MAVHPTAIVEDGARLGAGVEIGPFCIVGRDAVLGDGVRLLSHAIVTGKTSVGANTTIHPHAVIGGEAQIHNNNAPDARLEIGSGNVLREGVTISLGSAKGHNLTKIGDDNFLMAGSHIGHDCIVGNNVILANGVVIGGHFEIGDGVIMGGLAAGPTSVRPSARRGVALAQRRSLADPRRPPARAQRRGTAPGVRELRRR